MSSDHVRPMSHASDLSAASGLPPVEVPTIKSLQAKITQLQAKIKEHEELFFLISTDFLSLTDNVIRTVMAATKEPLNEKQSLVILAFLGLKVLAEQDKCKKACIISNTHMLPQHIQIKLEALKLAEKNEAL